MLGCLLRILIYLPLLSGALIALQLLLISPLIITLCVRAAIADINMNTDTKTTSAQLASLHRALNPNPKSKTRALAR
jgi:hypothetical protein